MALLVSLQFAVTDCSWTDSGDGYSVEVYYPEIAVENDTVGTVLEEYVTEKVDTFMEHYHEYYDESHGMEWTLEFNITEQPAPQGLICVLAWVWEYSGGAHGNSWTRGYVFDAETGELLDPVQILGGQEEFQEFAVEVIDRLEAQIGDDHWIERGAAADPENYHTLLPVPDDNGELESYRVVFPPYQVAAYVYGPVEVEIPAD